MRLQFVLSEIGIGLRRNLTMAISVVLVTFVSLTFVGAAALLQLQITQMKGDWNDKVEVVVYLCPTPSSEPSCAGGKATDAQIAEIKELLKGPEVAPLVKETTFTSSDEAFLDFKKRFGDEVWFAQTTADAIPASLGITLTDPAKYGVISDVVAGRPGVEKVYDQRKVFDQLFLVLNRATLLSVGVAAVMLLAAVLLITTTIRLSALSRRRETGIMRLVGASTLFIQLPFMLEGAIAAGIGALLATGTLWLGVHYLITDWVGSASLWSSYIGTSDVLALAPLLVGVALVLAAIASAVTLSKYTKV